MPQRQSTSLPKNWPKDIIFLTTLHIPLPLTPASVQRQPTPSPTLPLVNPVPLVPNPNVRITPITTPAHPAYTQHGLFSTRALPPSSFIIFYLGTLHPSSTADPTSNYDLSLDRELDLSIDATRRGNEARFINDYRGVRPDGPNAEFRDCLVEVAVPGGGKTCERRIGVFVLGPGKAGAKSKRGRGIAKGEEIVVSYGKGFWNARKDEDGEE
ncbi:hypothetical protein H2204_008931 [Knufia peltigerae]|uniref:SET domain-containing protein n=1 Tax=Knufia peltigerae TaxID=1002370 RepID=A0AA38XZX4_9EURO|nr:hypothetical protein H2204_008931 [Knufia peltigerae]